MLLVECDNANPDVYRAYSELVPTERTGLDGPDGWIHLVNICEAHARSTVVIDTAARNNVAARHYGQLLDSSLEALGAGLQVWSVINRRRDSLELFREWQRPSRQHGMRSLGHMQITLLTSLKPIVWEMSL